MFMKLFEWLLFETPYCLLCNKISLDSARRAESIDINFIAQKPKGVSKNHQKLHEHLPIFFEQTILFFRIDHSYLRKGLEKTE